MNRKTLVHMLEQVYYFKTSNFLHESHLVETLFLEGREISENAQVC